MAKNTSASRKMILPARDKLRIFFSVFKFLLGSITILLYPIEAPRYNYIFAVILY